jgi:hypothetical protein
VDQTGRLALCRHAQRNDRPLAPGIKAKGEIRTQWCHVIDIDPASPYDHLTGSGGDFAGRDDGPAEAARRRTLARFQMPPTTSPAPMGGGA